MIDFVGYACLKHIEVGRTSLPDMFEDVSDLLYTQEVFKDEYTHLNLTGRHEIRGKITRS